MSSHHIIRDEQEPALLLMQTHHRWDLIDQLLEWSPTLVVFEQVAEQVLSRGVKVDLILTTKNVEGNFQPLKVMVVSVPNFLSEALRYLLSRNHEAINIFCSSPQVHALCEGGYLDEFNSVNLFDGQMRHSLIRNHSLKKWVLPGKYEIWPPLASYQIEGFQETEMPADGTLTKSEKGMIKVTSDSNVFLFSEPI